MTAASESVGPQPRLFKLEVLAIVLLVLAVILVYRGSLDGAFVFDDVPAILENPTLRHPGDLVGVLAPPGDQAGTVGGRPVLNLSLALNYAFSGPQPRGYHVLNLGIHVAATLLLFGVICRTLDRNGDCPSGIDGSGRTANPQPHGIRGVSASAAERDLRTALPWTSSWSHSDGLLIAFFASLLWAVHPLQTEAVTYVVQRAESLMGLFYLLTLYCFVHCAGPRTDTVTTDEASVRCRSLLAGDRPLKIACKQAPTITSNKRLHSHTVSGQDPTDSPDVDSAHQSWGRGIWAVLGVLACLFGMATKEVMVSAPLVVLVYDRTFVTGSLSGAWRKRRGLYLGLAATWFVLAVLVAGTHGRGGSAGFAAPADVWPYVLTQCKAIVHYLHLAFWPDRLAFDYGTALVRHPGDVLPQCFLVLLLLTACAAAWRQYPGVGFLGFCFFVVLAPSSSVVPIATEPMAEHRMYLPLAAVSILVVAAIFAVLTRLTPRFARFGFCALGAAAALGLGAATVRRNLDFRSATALWADTVQKVPGNPRAHNDLAEAMLAAGEPAKAAAEFLAAVQVDPDYTPAQYNLGVTLLDSGRPQEAIQHLEKALSAPRHQAELHLYLGEAFERTGQHARAVDQYREALRLAPGNAEAAFGLGNALAAQSRYVEAVEALRLAVAWAPNHVGIRNNLANALMFSGRTEEAIAEFREALKRDPNNVTVRENLERALGEDRAGVGR
jgi:tetratricopeptide (TPR) repeat protein